MERREEILNGQLSFPKQLYKFLKIEDDEVKKLLVNNFFEHLWHNFLREKPVDSIIWYQEFNNKMFFNSMLLHLSKSGWITSVIDNNYAWIELNKSKLLKWLSEEEIQNLRFKYKTEKYRFKRTESTISNLTKLNGRIEDTGIKREGFMKAGNSLFRYDTKYITKYLPEIAFNLKKGLSGTNKDISYQEIIDELTNWYSINYYDYYCLGNNISDSRGRAIFQCTKKLFNPVSSKDARALLIMKGEELTSQGFKNIFAFIAELHGYRGKNIEDKIAYGEAMYITRQLPSIEEMHNTSNYDDLHIRIWLERIYKNLDSYEKEKLWYVPIEIDALASVIQFMGVLTNDHEYMDYTNLIGTEFKDIWTRPYCSRTHVKKALTPPLYGSSRNPRELWDANKLEYTTKQVNEIQKDLAIGIYANAKNFKDFIINNVQPKKKMKVKVWKDEFWIECNRYKWQETKQISYSIYTSSQGLIKTITKSVNLVHDLNQFKRYFVTLLIHGIDSQVANNICKEIDWIIPNHDSFTIHPNEANHVRQIYINNMEEIYKNRKQILKDYFQSIGIMEEYPEKCSEEIDHFELYCLK